MQEQVQAVGSSAMETIVELATFLNTEEGFAISEPDIRNCLTVFMNSGLDLLDEQESRYIFSTSFCKNKEQFLAFPESMKRFLKRQKERQEHAQEFRKLEQNKSDLAKMQRMIEQQKASAQNQLEDISVRKQEALLALQKESASDHPVTDQFEKTLQKLCKDKPFASPMLQKFSRKELPDVSESDSGAMEEAKKEVLQKAEESLLSGDSKQFLAMQKILNALNSLQNAEKEKLTVLQKQMRDVEEKFQKEQAHIKQELKKQQKEMQRVQNEIDRITAGLRDNESGKLTIKESSMAHRPFFQTTGGAVQTYPDPDTPECAKKEFRSLTEKEKGIIREYLKRNILYFRTKLTRHLDEMDRSAIDIGETAKGACKTGGIPMVLHYNRPKPGRADLMLVLDVSGSCRQASEMMLTFMYMLKAAFPHGCNAFAFVNSLYDISGLMDVREDIGSAISQVLETIPTKGVYSDYSRPIRKLKGTYSAKITKDTILIFMGDARNNRNDPCYNEFKFLCRKAKRAYWLNTDKIGKWGQGDSIAPGYAEFATMMEATSVAELTSFIQNGIR